MTTPQQYTPRDYSALDALAAAKRTADAILRSNPLTNAVVSQGLMRWTGNHVRSSDSQKIDYLWIGEFFPADTTMGGIPQKGISVVRDDSTGGTSAFALYDHDPGGNGLGLRQTIHIGSVDNERLMTESRAGGQQWPEENVYMGLTSRVIADWPRCVLGSGTFESIAEGRVNVIGNELRARFWIGTTDGGAGEYRVRIEGDGGDIIGPLATLGVNTSGVADHVINVSTERGFTRIIRLEARVTNGVGYARAAPISFRCYTQD